VKIIKGMEFVYLMTKLWKFIETRGRLVLTAGSHDRVSRPSAETQLVNLMFQPLNGENNYALAA